MADSAICADSRLNCHSATSKNKKIARISLNLRAILVDTEWVWFDSKIDTSLTVKLIPAQNNSRLPMLGTQSKKPQTLRPQNSNLQFIHLHVPHDLLGTQLVYGYWWYQYVWIEARFYFVSIRMKRAPRFYFVSIRMKRSSSFLLFMHFMHYWLQISLPNIVQRH